MEATGETYYAEMLITPGFSAPDAFYLRLYRMMDGEEITMLSLNTQAGRTEEENYFTAVLDWTGTIFSLDVRQYERADGGSDTQVRFYLNDPEMPLGEMVFSCWPLKEAVNAPLTEGKLRVDILASMDEDALSGLENALQNGIGHALVQGIGTMPEEAETLMNLFLQK